VESRSRGLTDWLVWEGGDCPVPYKTRVEVLFNDGGRTYGEAGLWSWIAQPYPYDECNIVSYREVK
jgi:hypothetical protein